MNAAVKITGQELHGLLHQAARYLQSASNQPFVLETDYYALISTDEWEKLEGARPSSAPCLMMLKN
ncbi:hypothetical protein [Hymenobacter glaciei]|uniref:hypothetical protein n=1 Tax=Hymenobacter glaciei TaxID=877209 RepID=UPI0031E8B2EF